MNLFLVILFVVIVVLAFIEDYLTAMQKYCILAVLTVIMIAAAALKDPMAVADADAYENMFYNYDNPLIEISTEPTFIYISRFVLAFGGSLSIVFLIYALISVPAKLFIMSKMTPCIFTALLVYIPVYYELHDLVQIRAAAACTFFFMALYFRVVKRNYLCAACFLIAVLFHYSALAILLVLIIGNRPANKIVRVVMASIIPIGFLMTIMHKDIFSLLPSAMVTGKIELYSNGAFLYDIIIPYKNLYFMAKCLFFCVCLCYYDFIRERVNFFPILMYSQAISILCMLTMTTIPIIGFRMSELFGVIDPLIFSYCLTLIHPKYVGRICVSLLGAFMIVFNMLTAQYFNK